MTAYGENVDTDYYDQFLTPSSPDCGGPCTLLNGPAFYKAAMSGYNYVSLLKNIGNFGSVGSNGQMTLNSLYGKPLYHQLSRNMYMAIKFTF